MLSWLTFLGIFLYYLFNNFAPEDAIYAKDLAGAIIAASFGAAAVGVFTSR